MRLHYAGFTCACPILGVRASEEVCVRVCVCVRVRVCVRIVVYVCDHECV